MINPIRFALVVSAALAACGEANVGEEEEEEGEEETNCAQACATQENPTGCNCNQTTGGCPVDSDERSLIEDTAALWIEAALGSVQGSRRNDLSVDSSLLALDTIDWGTTWGRFEGTACGEVGGVRLDARCMLPSDDPFYDDHDVCHVAECQSADVYVLRQYFTMRPITDPNVIHPFTYEIGTWATGTYDPNPCFTWIADKSVAGEVTMTNDVFQSISIAINGGAVIDMTVTGDITASGNELTEAPTSLDISLTIPLVGDDADGIALNITLDAARKPVGTISSGGSTIANVTSDVSGVWTHWDPLVAVEWLGACAP